MNDLTAPETDLALASRLSFVLSHTAHPGNIGSAARAIRTMGFRRLVLVAPERFPHAEASALAAGAQDVLGQAAQVDSLAEGIADCTLVIGATARARGVALPEASPREAAQQVRAALAGGAEVAIVFGNERSGLSNDEIKRCHMAVHIPADPHYSSLNLAQAVQVLAYEMRLALLAAPLEPAIRRSQPAASTELEGFFEHLRVTLHAIDFHKGRSDRTIMQRLRRLFLRAAPDASELRILRGILADAERMARLAGRV